MTNREDKIQHLLSNLLTGEQLYLKKSSLSRTEVLKFIKSFDQWQKRPQGQILYKPAIYAGVEVKFDYKRANIYLPKEFYLIAPFRDSYPFVDWGQNSLQISRMDLQATPEENALYDIFPGALSKIDNFIELEKELKEHLCRALSLIIYYNPGLQIYSGLKNSLEEFQLKCQEIIDEKIRDAIENLRDVYQRRWDQIEKKLMNQKDNLISDELEYTTRKRENLLTSGEPILAFLQGRKSINEIIQAGKEHSNLRRIKNKLDKPLDLFDELQQQLYDLNFELEEEVVAIDEKFKEYLKLTEKVQIRPEKSDITIHTLGLLWVPL